MSKIKPMKAKQVILLCGTLGLSFTCLAQNNPSLQTDLEKRSYAIGINMAKSLVRQEVQVDLKSMQLAMDHVLNNSEPLLNDQDVARFIGEIQQEIRDRQLAQRKQMEAEKELKGEENKVKGAAFLAENKTREGVQTTSSGLQYKIITQGEGPSPKPEDTVKVHYRGTLIDGTEFDSSYSRNEPSKFPANRVIKGWTEALQMMKVGSKYELYIPSDLAYGSAGRAPTIGPNEVLVFQVELLEIEVAKPAEPVTSDIIKVPSAEEMKKGAQIEIIKKDEVDKYINEKKDN